MNEQTSVIGILRGLWNRYCTGEDRREATPEECARLADLYDNDRYEGSGYTGGITQTVRKRDGKLWVEGEQLNRALSWRGFGDYGPTIPLLFDDRADETSKRSRERINAAIASITVSEFTAHLDSIGVEWRERPSDDESQWSVWMSKRELCDIIGSEERRVERDYPGQVEQGENRQRWRFKVATFDTAIQVRYENWLDERPKPKKTPAN